MKFKISHETPAETIGYGIFNINQRGKIITTENWRKAKPTNDGRKPTNAEYAAQNGISKRQASKKRRGY